MSEDTDILDDDAGDVEGPIPEGKLRRHSREHALPPDKRERLIRAAKPGIERFTIGGGMFMGWRSGEITHFSCDSTSENPAHNWVSLQERKVQIPPSMPCDREDRCASRIRVRRDGRKESFKGTWFPKSKHGARTQGFDWDPLIEEIIIQFVTSGYTRYPYSRQAVHDIVRRVADRASIAQLVYPHALRATAATMLADSGYNEHQLRQFMGWGPTSKAPYAYIQRSGAALQSSMRERGVKW